MVCCAPEYGVSGRLWVILDPLRANERATGDQCPRAYKRGWIARPRAGDARANKRAPASDDCARDRGGGSNHGSCFRA